MTRFLLIFIASIVIAGLTFQTSIYNYFMSNKSNELSKYLDNKTLNKIQDNVVSGGQDKLYSWKNSLAESNRSLVAWLNYWANYWVDNFDLPPDYVQQAQKEQAVVEPVKKPNKKQAKLPKPVVVTPSVITLTSADNVLMIGDSLLQGIAPHIASQLSKKYKIKSLDLSKASTGLSNSRFFDWHDVTKQALLENPNIKLVLVFLGANDINAGIPNGGSFNSSRWHSNYLYKVQSLVDIINKSKAKIIWVGLPNMGRKDLLNKNQILNKIYQQVAETNHFIYIDSNQVFGLGNKYLATIEINGKVARLRTNDGVHLAYQGQKILANAVISKISAEQQLTDSKKEDKKPLVK